MQQIVSYADPAVGAVFFNVAPMQQGRLAAEVIAAARARQNSAQAAQDYPMMLSAYIDTHHHTLVLHEWCHILQALVYPGLFFRCLREMQLVNGILSGLREDQSPSIPARVVLPEAWQYVWSSQLIISHRKVPPFSGLSRRVIHPARADEHSLRVRRAICQGRAKCLPG
jgi:hypothetical protein